MASNSKDNSAVVGGALGNSILQCFILSFNKRIA